MANPLNVLLVEDSADDAEAVLAELRDGGFDPVHERADDLESIDRAVDRKEWDLVLLDYNLPRTSAEEALVRIRERLPVAPVIVVSVFVGEEVVVSLMKAGAADYIPKDKLRRLCPAVERALLDAASRRDMARAEETTRRLVRDMQVILDNLPAIAFRKDSSSRYVAVNRHFVAHKNCRPEDVVGKFDPDIYPPDLAALFRDEDRRIIETGEPLRFEHRSRRTDRVFDVIKIPLREESGETTGLVGMVFDITDRVRAERERKRLEEQLGMSRKLDAIGQLAGGVAHEFNNALSVILSYCGFLLDGLPPDNPLRADVHEIRKAGERTAALTKQLLAFSRRQNPEPRAVDVNESLSDLSHTLLRLVGDHVTLGFEPAGAAMGVFMDPTQLEQIMINLAINARDAMPGGGTISISTSKANLGPETPTVEPGEFVCIAVSDTGAGISPEVRERLFEPFFTTKPIGKGTGLGLSMVYGIVRQNGGHIEVESAPGKGATFRVYFRRHAGPAAAAKPETAEHRTPGTGAILLVEDEEAVRKATARTLRGAGYTVEEAPGGNEGLSLFGAAGKVFDLVLTDVIMPGMGGAEMAIRVREIKPAQKIIFTSGYTDDMVGTQGAIRKGDVMLPKPVDKKALLAAVKKALET